MCIKTGPNVQHDKTVTDELKPMGSCIRSISETPNTTAAFCGFKKDDDNHDKQ